MPKIPRSVTDPAPQQGAMKMPATKFDRKYYGNRKMREPRIENPFFPQPGKVKEREYRQRHPYKG